MQPAGETLEEQRLVLGIDTGAAIGNADHRGRGLYLTLQQDGGTVGREFEGVAEQIDDRPVLDGCRRPKPGLWADR